MKHVLVYSAAPLAGLLALSACGEAETIMAGSSDPQAASLKRAAPVELPPMIQANRTYRCKDNSLVYAEFYTNHEAHLRTAPGGAPTVLMAVDGKPPFTAEGWSISAAGTEVDITRPGKGTQNCKG